MQLHQRGRKPRRICRACVKPHLGNCKRKQVRARWPITVRTLRAEGRIA